MENYGNIFGNIFHCEYGEYAVSACVFSGKNAIFNAQRRLITQRSQVQILTPLPITKKVRVYPWPFSLLAAGTGGRALVHRRNSLTIPPFFFSLWLFSYPDYEPQSGK
jgi:hypothetical protein